MEEWPLANYFPGDETINRGVTGQRLAGFLLRFRPDVAELKPQYVVIEVGSYNFRPNTDPRENFDYVVTLAEVSQFTTNRKPSRLTSKSYHVWL